MNSVVYGLAKALVRCKIEMGIYQREDARQRYFAAKDAWVAAVASDAPNLEWVEVQFGDRVITVYRDGSMRDL